MDEDVEGGTEGVEPSVSGAAWSEGEINASVNAYITMLRAELAGDPYVKAEFRRKLVEGPLSARSDASVEYRMQNISWVIDQMGLPRIAGYVPASSVGHEVTTMISEAVLREAPDLINKLGPTDDPDEVENRSQRLLESGIPRPVGGRLPEKTSVSTTSFKRDPRVVAWVRKEAGGVCESCGEDAPFSRNGIPFLEVHHVRPLSEGGTDSVENAVAVCPNCHRGFHLADGAEARSEELYATVSRLEKN